LTAGSQKRAGKVAKQETPVILELAILNMRQASEETSSGGLMIAPVTLENAAVRLEPLRRDHATELANAAADGKLWNLWYTSVPSPDSVAAYVEEALAAQVAGLELPFVIRLRESGRVVGSTRYLHIVEKHKRLEIGSTWIAKSRQGTVVNPACKLLLLDHAFTTLGVNRVEFLTHSKNAQSRAALLKLGATEEGILRQHKVLPDGTLRDSVVFSILASEWPLLRKTLQRRLDGADASRPS
jgi:RimJ/RimL family protein N-acetyltransferase